MMTLTTSAQNRADSLQGKSRFGIQLQYHSYQSFAYSDNVAGMRVYDQPGADPILPLGLFYEYKASERLTLRSEVFFPSLTPIGFVIANLQDTCFLCPVDIIPSAWVSAIGTNLSAKLSLGLFPKLSIIGGISPHITTWRRKVDIDRLLRDPYYKGEHTEEFRIGNAATDAVKSVYVFYSIGLSYDLSRRFNLALRYQNLLSNGYLNPIEFNGESYPISSTYEYTTFTLSYNFYSFKLPKFGKKLDERRQY